MTVGEHFGIPAPPSATQPAVTTDPGALNSAAATMQARAEAGRAATARMQGVVDGPVALLQDDRGQLDRARTSATEWTAAMDGMVDITELTAARIATAAAEMEPLAERAPELQAEAIEVLNEANAALAEVNAAKGEVASARAALANADDDNPAAVAAARAAYERAVAKLSAAQLKLEGLVERAAALEGEFEELQGLEGRIMSALSIAIDTIAVPPAPPIPIGTPAEIAEVTAEMTQHLFDEGENERAIEFFTTSQDAFVEAGVIDDFATDADLDDVTNGLVEDQFTGTQAAVLVHALQIPEDQHDNDAWLGERLGDEHPNATLADMGISAASITDNPTAAVGFFNTLGPEGTAGIAGDLVHADGGWDNSDGVRAPSDEATTALNNFSTALGDASRETSPQFSGAQTGQVPALNFTGADLIDANRDLDPQKHGWIPAATGPLHQSAQEQLVYLGAENLFEAGDFDSDFLTDATAASVDLHATWLDPIRSTSSAPFTERALAPGEEGPRNMMINVVLDTGDPQAAADVVTKLDDIQNLLRPSTDPFDRITGYVRGELPVVGDGSEIQPITELLITAGQDDDASWKIIEGAADQNDQLDPAFPSDQDLGHAVVTGVDAVLAQNVAALLDGKGHLAMPGVPVDPLADHPDFDVATFARAISNLAQEGGGGGTLLAATSMLDDSLIASFESGTPIPHTQPIGEAIALVRGAMAEGGLEKAQEVDQAVKNFNFVVKAALGFTPLKVGTAVGQVPRAAALLQNVPFVEKIADKLIKRPLWGAVLPGAGNEEAALRSIIVDTAQAQGQMQGFVLSALVESGRELSFGGEPGHLMQNPDDPTVYDFVTTDGQTIRQGLQPPGHPDFESDDHDWTTQVTIDSAPGGDLAYHLAGISGHDIEQPIYEVMEDLAQTDGIENFIEKNWPD